MTVVPIHRSETSVRADACACNPLSSRACECRAEGARQAIEACVAILDDVAEKNPSKRSAFEGPAPRAALEEAKTRMLAMLDGPAPRATLDGPASRGPAPRAEKSERSANGKHRYHFPLPDMARCKACDGVARVELDVRRSGYSVGSGYEHAESCPTLRCPHGVLWAQWADCTACEAGDMGETEESEEFADRQGEQATSPGRERSRALARVAEGRAARSCEKKDA